MVKQILPVLAVVVLLTSCSTLKPLNFTSNKQVVSGPASPAQETSTRNSTTKKEVKFIDDIAVTPQAPAVSPEVKAEEKKTETVATRGLSIEETKPNDGLFGNRSAAIEAASPVQLKYSILLDTEVEQLQNKVLLENIDVWYGTRYRMGGTTKNGIDCSAFVQAVFAGAFAITLPRTAREQYKVVRRISRTELKEGDLLFFNTRGGVSHVGIYLQNNKFVHASASQGVTISDMFDTYYLKRFIAAGRIEEIPQGQISSN